MNKLIVLFPLLLALIVPNCVDAQRLIGKELKSSDPSLYNDDKVYQWVRYTYVMGTDTLDAAFDINGKRITPNGYRPKKVRYYKGVDYCGDGVFEVYSKKKDKFGNAIVSGYDTDGKCIFPLTLMELLDCSSISYIGYGLFELITKFAEKNVYSLYNKKGECLIPKEMGFIYVTIESEDDLKYIECFIEKNSSGKHIHAAYDLDGKVVMPKSLGYTYIYYSEGYWNCDDASGNSVTYSKDLKYVADGFYSKKNASEFNQKKRSNPNYNGPYNFNPNYRPSSNSYTPQQPQTQQPQQQTQQPQQQQTIRIERDPVPMQVWKSCYGCGGSGQCQTCYGQGWRFLTNSQPHAQCITCGGNGRCNMCAGQGGHYKVEYK